MYPSNVIPGRWILVVFGSDPRLGCDRSEAKKQRSKEAVVVRGAVIGSVGMNRHLTIGLADGVGVKLISRFREATLL